LARSLGYDTGASLLPREIWNLFAGCGNPLEEIIFESDWTVLDLGCGVGIDCQLAALQLHPPGRAIGLDMTQELLQRARTSASTNPALHCHWILADGEHSPLQDESVHLVSANGSFNLMPTKRAAMEEIHRILKPGGQLVVADLLRMEEMKPVKDGFEDAWAWCVAGALSSEELDALLKATGFSRWETKIKSTYGPVAAAQVEAFKAK
jgi:ubiquinone/menaquinone biosynthesis C-methylase UbiE